MCAPASVCVCMHLPSVHRTLIAIPSGRQESAGLLWDICTFIRLHWSSRCSTKRGPVPLFHHFFFASLLPCLSPILPPLGVFHTLRYFSTRPCSCVFSKCYRHGSSGYIRPVQRGRTGRNKGNVWESSGLAGLEHSCSVLAPYALLLHGVSRSLNL